MAMAKATRKARLSSRVRGGRVATQEKRKPECLGKQSRCQYMIAPLRFLRYARPTRWEPVRNWDSRLETSDRRLRPKQTQAMYPQFYQWDTVRLGPFLEKFECAPPIKDWGNDLGDARKDGRRAEGPGSGVCVRNRGNGIFKDFRYVILQSERGPEPC